MKTGAAHGGNCISAVRIRRCFRKSRWIRHRYSERDRFEDGRASQLDPIELRPNIQLCPTQHKADRHPFERNRRYARTPCQRELYYVCQPYVFYTVRTNAENFANIETMCGKRVGAICTSVVETGAIVKWSEENCTKAGKPAIIVVPGENTPQVRLMVKQGFADAGLTGTAIIAYQNKLEGDQFVVIGKPVIKLLTGMAFSKEKLDLARPMILLIYVRGGRLGHDRRRASRCGARSNGAHSARFLEVMCRTVDLTDKASALCSPNELEGRRSNPAWFSTRP
ncbi:transporter substrate-binding domain-containing protein [Bradyrhizobium sp. SSUT77]|uniref:transporter substrate-binding domain-containing protein n=1 Tax=Bradyrhizobium sp. SSUT77 TaxID=3040603 RepID=UPI00244C61BB|nr:transporter substrate-binding domain-containing protein [Bradyrhizobium sp. SSUT77]MDH2348179.1 hypothetical protein [Bradyrhizobium sp. SSUT77]